MNHRRALPRAQTMLSKISFEHDALRQPIAAVLQIDGQKTIVAVRQFVS